MKKLHPNTIRKLAEVVCGGGNGSGFGASIKTPSKYRRGWEIEEFLNRSGVEVPAPPGSRAQMAELALESVNGTAQMDVLLQALTSPLENDHDLDLAISVAEHVSNLLAIERVSFPGGAGAMGAIPTAEAPPSGDPSAATPRQAPVDNRQDGPFDGEDPEYRSSERRSHDEFNRASAESPRARDSEVISPRSAMICYSHQDESYLNELRAHLAALQRQNAVLTWHDRRIGPGRDIDAELDDRIETSEIILLLISADFIASDYCYKREMTRAIERHREGSASVIPVILRPCDWKELPFGRLNAVPKDGVPITEHANRDSAYLEVAQAVRTVAQVASDPDLVVSSQSRSGGDRNGGRPLGPGGRFQIKRGFTDHDRDEFLEKSFEAIRRFFESSLDQLDSEYPELRSRFKSIDADCFEAFIYVNGEKRSSCGIWVGDLTGFGHRNIFYSSGGANQRNSFNESITVEDDGHSLYLRPAGMAYLTGRRISRLDSDGAPEYLWGLFLKPLQ